MKILFNTIKWDGISHAMHFRWMFVGLFIALALSQIIPVQALDLEYEYFGLRTVASLSIFIINAIPVVLGVYVGILYPTINSLFGMWMQPAFIERLTNRPFSIRLIVVFFWNTIAFYLGFAIIYFSSFFLRRFDTDTTTFLYVDMNFGGIGIGPFNALFFVAFFIPISAIYVYLGIFAENAKAGLSMTIICWIVGLSLIINGFMGFWQPEVTMAIYIIQFVVLLVLCRWIYEKKLEVE